MNADLLAVVAVLAIIYAAVIFPLAERIERWVFESKSDER